MVIQGLLYHPFHLVTIRKDGFSMQGSVRKRGNTWSYRFDMGTINGKRQRKEKGGFKTKKEAEIALAKAVNEFNTAGLVFTPSEVTLADFLDFWVEEYVKKNCKPNTCRVYCNMIRMYIKPRIGQYKLKALTPAAIQKYLNDLKTEQIKKATAVKVKSVLNEALNYAVVPCGYLQGNPAFYVKLPSYPDTPKDEQRDAITVQQFNEIAEHFKNTPCYIPLIIGFYTGLRIGEVFALTWDDIDLDNRIIHVRHTAISIERNSDLNPLKGQKVSPWYIGTPKTPSSIRDVDFGDTLYRVLKEEKKRQHRQRFEGGQVYILNYLEPVKDTKGDTLMHFVHRMRSESSDGLTPVDMVCVQDNGKYYNLTNQNCKVNHWVVDNMNIKFDFHTLRHTHGTILAANGVAPKIIQERLGHAKIDITMNRYVHATEDKKKDAVKAFESAM